MPARSCLFLVVGITIHTGCADIIGAEFDVDPIAEDGGAPSSGGGGGTGGTTDGGGGQSSGYCPDGAVEVAAGAPYPYGIAVGDDYVIWTESDRVSRALKDGSSEPEVVQDGLVRPSRITVEGNHAYFADPGDADDGTVWSVDLDTGEPHLLASGLRGPQGITVRDGIVYFTTVGAKGSGSPIMQIDSTLPGSNPAQFLVAPAGAGFLEAGEDALYGSSSLGGPFFVWKKDYQDMGNEQPTIAVPVEVGVSVVRLTGSLPIYAAYPSGPIARYQEDLSQPLPLVLETSQMADITVAGDWVYFAEFGTGTIGRVLVAGGTPKTVATMTNVNGMASDGEAIYFTQFQPGGSVCRLATER
ncbi:MAG: hypothetical protein HOW73_42970 [Polyangiaceae bacterium]|nr:hypothetical protein [Polyangiaceae bacterium]